MIARLARNCRALASDASGATLVEFAFILPPMLVLLIGGLDVGYQSYARAMMQSALNDAARVATVENPTFTTSGDTMDEQIEARMDKIVGKIAVDSTITVTRKSYFDFGYVGNPEKIMTDNNGNGQFDEDDGDCWEDSNGNGEFDTDAGQSGRGQANDVVFYSAHIDMPRLFPLDAFLPLNERIEMTLETAVRNQPYDNRTTPVVLCAAGS